jgi:hypothetical protein
MKPDVFIVRWASAFKSIDLGNSSVGDHPTVPTQYFVQGSAQAQTYQLIALELVELELVELKPDAHPFLLLE